MAIGRLFLIHWNADEVEQRAELLRTDGWDVETEASDGARGGKRIVADPPAAVVIDLTRLPSHGRETAHALRSYKATRTTPIVFVGGEGEPLEKTKAKVPDAIYTTAGRLKRVLAKYASKPSQA